MKKVVSIIRPFDLKQKIYVFENGNKLDIVETNLDNIPDSTLKLAYDYETNQIDLSGPKQFSKKIKNLILEKNATTYSSKVDIEVNLI